MKQMYYRVIDCEHESDAQYAVFELGMVGDFNLDRTKYEYEDDENPEADHEICGCVLDITVRDEDVEKFRAFGCYGYGKTTEVCG